MFGRQKKDEPAVPVEPETTHPERAGAKNRPTPSRKDAQAARRTDLIPADREAAAKASKAREREQRLRQREAMYAGEEWALLPRDRGPARRYIRDYVDARWNIGEFLLPLMLMGFAASLFQNPTLTLVGLVIIYLPFLASIIDFWLLWRRLKRKVTEKFGEFPSGALMSTFSRYVQIRPTRVPRPQVRRGEYPR